MASLGSTGRLGGACGAVFSVLYFVGTGLLAGPISQSDSLETAGATFNEQADSFDAGASLLLVGTAAGAATTLVGAAVMGGTAFLAEAAPVDGRTAAFAHSATERE